MQFVITFTYKEPGGQYDYNTDDFYCFTAARKAYRNYDEAVNAARQLALKNTDKKFYVTKILSVSESIPPVPADPVKTTILG